ncbi:MAG: efflux RND transporter periplasmic adaptor subunit [Bdellovibrionaceae bacterium]|nr:efflux RND transporter periplasmic adaptor subunit [Pseudobdellovibrionaceae bacterium]
MSSKHFLLAMVASVILAISFFSARYYYFSSRFVEVEPHRGDLVEAVYALGKVITDQHFEVKIGVISTVKNVYVSEGESVKKGDQLIELDSNILFRAPFDGIVTWVASHNGETALPQMTLLRVDNVQNRYIELTLEQEGALRVQVGQPAKVSFESLRGTVLSGKVTALFSRNDEFLAHVKVDDLAESVLPGMTADVSVEVGKITNALLIPVKAVTGGKVLIKHANGKREKMKLIIGHVDGQWAEVKGNDLREGDTVLLPKNQKE